MHGLTAEELIRLYDLQPHPEGGWFRETYRAAGSIPGEALPAPFGGPRSYSTAIHFLLPAGSRSGLHRLRCDEVWHFYLGGPLELWELSAEGRVSSVLLGPDVRAGQKLQHVVPAGAWFGALPVEGSAWCLVGCTVAPGFDFADFEMARRDELLGRYPQAAERIARLL